jgi:hypothetical protein
MKEDGFGRQLGEMVREFDPVPEAPADEIWSGVVAARRHRRRKPARWWRPTLAWGVGMAATLVIGIAIGRTGMLTLPAPEVDPVLAAGPAPEPPREFRLAAADYLVRTEMLLAAFPSGARQGRAPEVAAWARQLLLDTRLLLDSPAAIDPDLSPLLSDLELVLAQIASLRARDPAGEIEMIEDGIEQNRVLARLRLAANAAGGVNGDD